jgi:hypothetical protein
MQVQTARRPYLFKDPRFSCTLATWMPFLAAETTFLCVFREPIRTMNSIMRIVRDERYPLGHQDDSGTSVPVLDLDLPKRLASAEQARRGLALRTLRRAADEASDPAARMPSGARADVSMLRPKLNRSTMTAAADSSAEELFRLLLELAEQKYA